LKKLLMPVALALAAASVYAAFRFRPDIPFWLAAGGLALALTAVLLAGAAHYRLGRLRRDYAGLADRFEQSVYRLEKRNDLAQTRLTQMANGNAPFAARSAAEHRERGFSWQEEGANPIVFASTAPARSHSPSKTEKGQTRFALPERLAREHKSAGKSAKALADLGPFPLTLQPILEMPDAVPTAYIAFGRLADKDHGADEALPETFDKAEFCDRLIAYAIRNCEQLIDSNGAPTPVICGLTAEFLADSDKVRHLVTIMNSRPALSKSLIFSIPAKMTGTVALQRDALDRIAATGVKFAVAGDLASLAIRKSRAKLPLAYILASAHEFSSDASLAVLRSLVSKASAEAIRIVGLGADAETVQMSLMDAGVRHVTSSKAAPPRLLKSEVDVSAAGHEQPAAE
jgi:hypothetical protein